MTIEGLIATCFDSGDYVVYNVSRKEKDGIKNFRNEHDEALPVEETCGGY